jgi:hypothetical protein
LSRVTLNTVAEVLNAVLAFATQGTLLMEEYKAAGVEPTQ